MGVDFLRDRDLTGDQKHKRCYYYIFQNNRCLLSSQARGERRTEARSALSSPLSLQLRLREEPPYIQPGPAKATTAVSLLVVISP